MPRFLRKKIRCFAYGKRSDVKRQQPDVKSRRTAEESRTILSRASELLHTGFASSHRHLTLYQFK